MSIFPSRLSNICLISQQVDYFVCIKRFKNRIKLSRQIPLFQYDFRNSFAQSKCEQSRKTHTRNKNDNDKYCKRFCITHIYIFATLYSKNGEKSVRNMSHVSERFSARTKMKKLFPVSYIAIVSFPVLKYGRWIVIIRYVRRAFFRFSFLKCIMKVFKAQLSAFEGRMLDVNMKPFCPFLFDDFKETFVYVFLNNYLNRSRRNSTSES